MTTHAFPAVRPLPRAAAPPSLPFPGGVPVPPFALPAAHLGAALAFWLAGAMGLVWVAPELAAGNFSLPRVVAVAHLFTLGWITTSIQGAFYQFLPVALGAGIRSRRLAAATGAMHAAGLAAFVAGMLAGSHAAVLAGAALFGTGLLLFAGNLAATLAAARLRGLTWWCLAAATGFLAITVVFGAALAGNLRWGYLGAERFMAMGVHLHVAVGGWVMLVVVGVAHRLLPMFLLSHGASPIPGRAAAVLLSLGAGILVVLHHHPDRRVFVVAGALLAAGGGAFVAQAALYLRHSRRPALDSGLRLAGVAVAFLAASLALGPAFLARGLAAPRLATAYGIALVLGGLSLFVAGHHYKIVPFLVWYHRFGPFVGTRPVPRVSDLVHGRAGDVAAALLAMGAAGLVAATLAGATDAARWAAAAFALGAAVLTAQMTSLLLWRRP